MPTPWRYSAGQQLNAQQVQQLLDINNFVGDTVGPKAIAGQPGSIMNVQDIVNRDKNRWGAMGSEGGNDPAYDPSAPVYFQGFDPSDPTLRTGDAGYHYGLYINPADGTAKVYDAGQGLGFGSYSGGLGAQLADDANSFNLGDFLAKGLISAGTGGVLGGGLGLGSIGTGAITGGTSSALNGNNPLVGALTGGIGGGLSDYLGVSDYLKNLTGGDSSVPTGLSGDDYAFSDGASLGTSTPNFDIGGYTPPVSLGLPDAPTGQYDFSQQGLPGQVTDPNFAEYGASSPGTINQTIGQATGALDAAGNSTSGLGASVFSPAINDAITGATLQTPNEPSFWDNLQKPKVALQIANALKMFTAPNPVSSAGQNYFNSGGSGQGGGAQVPMTQANSAPSMQLETPNLETPKFQPMSLSGAQLSGNSFPGYLAPANSLFDDPFAQSTATWKSPKNYASALRG